jgi:dTDP-4-dehydrorhamnose reductase
MKILLFGGSGTLGSELLKLNPDIIAPTSNEVNINDGLQLTKLISKVKPDVIINAAAEINNRLIEKYSHTAIQTNIIGAANLASICIIRPQIKYVYISTDYIYKGDKGNYYEDNEILPTNLYAWTKLGGECSARCVENHLIIRTSFGKRPCEYKQAFIDKVTSKDYVDVIAPMILKAATSELKGVLNIGTKAKTMLEYAYQTNEDIELIRGDNSNHSLNLTKWNNYNENN